MEVYEFDVDVRTVNGEKPDVNGNVEIPSYSHPDSGVAAGTYKSVTVNKQGHVTGGSNPTTLAGYGIKDAVKMVNGKEPDEAGNVNVEGVPIGFEYFQMNPNIPAGSLPLLGLVYSRSTYADLWAWVQTQQGYLISESEWQRMAVADNGNVPFYSDGNGSTTFRVPALKCWIKGAEGIEEVGGYLPAGLPDVSVPMYNESGAVENSMASGSSTVEAVKWSLSAFNSIYGNSDTVQPESIVGLWLVKAFAKIATTGNTTTDQIAENIEELNRTITNNIPSLATSIAKMQSYFQGSFTRTLLWGNESTWKNANTAIELSRSWKEFDGLQFCMFFDDAAYRPFMPGGQILWKWEFEEMIRQANINPSGQGRIIRLDFGDGVYIQWRADGKMPTDLVLTVADENCGIGAVYGISLAATGVTNNTAIDVTTIQERIGGMLTADNHLILPSGLEVW